MIKIYVETDSYVPRYVCTSCNSCASIIGKSLCKIKNRGCCWYFPKFSLYDIHRMSKEQKGLNILRELVSNPHTYIYNYYIHAKGYFDEIGFNEYKKSGKQINAGYIEDHTIFFRACPFVKPGKGCTLPPRYRTFVCNFFICREIADAARSCELFKEYEEERLKYSRWLQWENEGLKHILSEKNFTLNKNFEDAVTILQETELSQYDFPHLDPIVLDDSWYKGA